MEAIIINLFFYYSDLYMLLSRIDGQTSLSTRQKNVKEYNNPESDTFIFLMSTRAGGIGIDLVSYFSSLYKKGPIIKDKIKEKGNNLYNRLMKWLKIKYLT